ncbi:MAG: hypothetical protein ACQEQ0_08085 [Bacteroidota bacterium]
MERNLFERNKYFTNTGKSFGLILFTNSGNPGNQFSESFLLRYDEKKLLDIHFPFWCNGNKCSVAPGGPKGS